jgi:hypothetical protein
MDMSKSLTFTIREDGVYLSNGLFFPVGTTLEMTDELPTGPGITFKPEVLNLNPFVKFMAIGEEQEQSDNLSRGYDPPQPPRSMDADATDGQEAGR